MEACVGAHHLSRTLTDYSEFFAGDCRRLLSNALATSDGIVLGNRSRPVVIDNALA